MAYEDTDNLIKEGIALVRKEKKCSVSFIQRKLRLGYMQASSIVDKLEALQVIGPSRGSKPREILPIPKYTKKEKGFVRDFIKTGNGTKSALKNYNVRTKNKEKTAGVIAVENLAKPRIQQLIKSIAESIPDDLIVTKHNELLRQKRLDYIMFPKMAKDPDIISHMEANGLSVVTIRFSDQGKMAFYSMNDVIAVSKGLDMAYKIKGTYAPEKVKHMGGIVLGDLEELSNEQLAKLIAEGSKDSRS